jgi:hypothetical protein
LAILANAQSIQPGYHQTAASWGGTAYPGASVHSLIQACQNQQLSAKRGTYKNTLSSKSNITVKSSVHIIVPISRFNYPSND